MHLTQCLDPPSAVGWLPGKVEYCRSPTSTKDCSRSSRRAGRQAHRKTEPLPGSLATVTQWAEVLLGVNDEPVLVLASCPAGLMTSLIIGFSCTVELELSDLDLRGL
jgi:hypothetical protein